MKSSKDEVRSTQREPEGGDKKAMSRRGLAAFGIGGALFALGACGDDDTVPAPTTTGSGGSGGGTGGTGGTGGAGGGGCDPQFDNTIVGEVKDGTGQDYSPTTGKERTAVPSACWQCVARDGIIGYVEDGRLMHLEGNPNLLRTNGKLCARGQGGVGQVYDPDRLLFPMRRTGARGSGQWERITWKQALDELEGKLKPLLQAGTPEKLMFHYGRMKASNSQMVKGYFLPAFGTGTTADHTSICEAAKWTAQELTWGKHYDINDVENAKVIINFGANVFEAHTNHLPFTQRLTNALRDNGTKLYTFDVRLSNTAARSTKWIPIASGTDQAVVLAMAYHIITQNLMPQAGKDFVNAWTDLDATGFNDKVAKLKYFLQNPKGYLQTVLAADPSVPAYWSPNDQPASGYTPEWAESVSGVPAATIKQLAAEYAAGSPGSTIISYRGAVAHFNGVNTERAVMLLEAMCGNLEVPGGRVHAVGAGWTWSKTYPTPTGSTKKISGIDEDSRYLYPTHHSSHRVLEGLKQRYLDGDPNPEVYMVYCYTPAYANGNMDEAIDILKDTKIIPYHVVFDVAYTEAAMYADLLLPDANYLERWGWEDMVSMNMIPEWYIRQPMLDKPLGEAQDTMDTFIALAGRLKSVAPELAKYEAIGSAENFVKAACNDTAAVNDAGKAAGHTDGFEFMKAVGAYYDPKATPKYQAHLAPVSVTSKDPASVADNDPAKYIWQDAEGILWEGTKAEYNTGYRKVKSAYSRYKGQVVGGKQYAGFKPDKVNKSGLCELESKLLLAKHYPGLPIFMKIPEHQTLGQNELVLTTFKLAAQTHSRTQNCKYLTEISHDNPAWLNAATAAALGIKDGDSVTLTIKGAMFNDWTLDPAKRSTTKTKSMKVKVHVTEGIHPKCIAISHSLGHWAYGRYASGKPNPFADGDTDQKAQVAADPDAGLIWWKSFGYRGNTIVPNAGDPINGMMRWMDTVVVVS